MDNLKNDNELNKLRQELISFIYLDMKPELDSEDFIYWIDEIIPYLNKIQLLKIINQYKANNEKINKLMLDIEKDCKKNIDNYFNNN